MGVLHIKILNFECNTRFGHEIACFIRRIGMVFMAFLRQRPNENVCSIVLSLPLLLEDFQFSLAFACVCVSARVHAWFLTMCLTIVKTQVRSAEGRVIFHMWTDTFAFSGRCGKYGVDMVVLTNLYWC